MVADPMPTVGAVLLGALAFGCAVAGLFFFRFWRATADRFFAFFGVAFWLLGLHWMLLGLTDARYEYRPTLYLVRLAAFVTVLIAIIDKNRATRP
jgi:hypothetical protein